MTQQRTFLTADWRHLLMLNYSVNPALLQPFVPAGTELDQFDGKTYASLVGFEFNNTRLSGIAIPFHRSFEEVNLRFYVRHQGGSEASSSFANSCRNILSQPLLALHSVKTTVACPCRIKSPPGTTMSSTPNIPGVRSGSLRFANGDERAGIPARGRLAESIHHRTLLGIRYPTRR